MKMMANKVIVDLNMLGTLMEDIVMSNPKSVDTVNTLRCRVGSRRGVPLDAEGF